MDDYINYVNCECGDRGERKLENPQPGTLYGFICKGCNRILIGRFAGNSKYKRNETELLEKAIFDVFAEERPRLTVRRLYYALEVRGVVPKTENGYRKVQYALVRMRKSGALPYNWIADNTRWQKKPVTYNDLRSALDLWHQAYRRDLWRNQKDYVEIWIEKDALAGVVYEITANYDVPLMVTRGFSSLTFIHDAADYLETIDKQIYIYHFGDLDPSGVSASQQVEKGLKERCNNVHFEMAAVTAAQVEKYQLATRPNKKKDSRAKRWKYPYSCELDALPTPILRQMVEDCISRHIDPWQYERIKRIETLERETLSGMLENLVPVQNFRRTG